jgi:hypothetical protein
MVYILSKNGQPLMPTEDHRKVRLLLKSKKAIVIKRTPFTIRILGTSHNYVQPVTLGIDAGSKHVGISASTETKELFAAELRPRNDVTGLMSTRLQFRRSRRNRTTRYRQARFENRVRSKHKGWLAPSVEVKIHNHIQGINLVCRILPVTEIRIETAEFDLQRLKAMEEGKPLPVGTDYQLGEMYDEYNVRQYVFHRDDYTCQCCGAHGKGVKLHVHHIETRKTGGNAPDNLITLCPNCHRLYHLGKISLPVKKRRMRSTRDAAFMGIMRKTLIARVKALYPDVKVSGTYGYITKYLREKNSLIKTHCTDALCIARHPNALRMGKQYTIIPVRRHNRQIYKATINKGGVRKRNQAAYTVKGFRLYDKVLFRNQEGFIFGRRTSGSFDIRRLDGTRLSAGAGYKKLTLLEKAKPLLIA